MMQYQIFIEKKAQKFIKKLPKQEKERLIRAIYTIDNGELIICVVDAGSRGDIYKKY